MQNKVYEGVNWNKQGKDYTTLFWEQNIKQFWIDTEYIPSKDIDSWRSLSPEMQNAYMKVLGGLTMLDTLQSNTGMTSVIPFIDDLQQQAVLSYMCIQQWQAPNKSIAPLSGSRITNIYNTKRVALMNFTKVL